MYKKIKYIGILNKIETENTLNAFVKLCLTCHNQKEQKKCLFIELNRIDENLQIKVKILSSIPDFSHVFARIRIDLTFDLRIVNKHFPGPDFQNR